LLSSKEMQEHHLHEDLPERKNDMNLLHEELARAQISARLGAAQELRRGHHLAMARRTSRKAEKAAERARLALARAI